VAGVIALAVYFGFLFFLIQRKNMKKDEHVLTNEK